MANRSITLKNAKKELAAYGMVITKRDAGEYRVNFKGGQESTAYYTDDIDDAVNTGVVMSRTRPSSLDLAVAHRRTRSNPRGRNARPGDRKTVRDFTDAELQHMIKVTKGAAKEFFLKEAGRRVAEEMRKGRTTARRVYGAKNVRRNPPIFTGGKRKVSGSPAHLIGMSVYEIRYRHANDGKDYKHPFERDDVLMLGMPDGSLKIESASGKKLWQNFDV